MFIKSQKIAAAHVSLFLRQTSSGYRWELQILADSAAEHSVEQSAITHTSPSEALNAGFERFEAALRALNSTR